MDLPQFTRKLFSKPTQLEKVWERIPFQSGLNGTRRRRGRVWDQNSDTIGSRAMGWTSIGIGLAELAAPKQVETLLGLDDTPDQRGVLRVLGVRELMHGVSLLAGAKSRQLRAGIWSRVAGDALDCALLSAAAAKTRRPALFAAVAGMVLAIGVADVLCAVRQSQRNE